LLLEVLFASRELCKRRVADDHAGGRGSERVLNHTPANCIGEAERFDSYCGIISRARQTRL
jgi:hypothetical protein